MWMRKNMHGEQFDAGLLPMDHGLHLVKVDGSAQDQLMSFLLQIRAREPSSGAPAITL